MLTAAIVAFGHFIAFFVMTSALVLELVLLRESMTAETARRIQRADRILGAAAVSILVLGFMRVIYFEKGAEYYFDNLFFQIKLGLFIVTAVISIYPTSQFFAWTRQLRQVDSLELPEAKLRKLKKAIHWELILIAGILLCASLMAKGFGI